MSSTSEELHNLFEVAQKQAVVISESFEEPDDDWMPIALALNRDNSLLVVGLDPAFFSNSRSKDDMVEFLVSTIKDKDIQAFVLQLSVWMLQLEPGEMKHPEVLPEGVPDSFADDPRSIEAVVIHGLSADENLCARALIQRSDDQPPKLSEFQTDIQSTAGRMIEPFRDALKIAKRESEEGGS